MSSDRDRSSTSFRLPVATLYSAGLAQGLTLVSFPASSAVLKQMHGFTDAQYGAIFLPQVAFAVVGALGGGAMANRLGLKTLLIASLILNTVSQLLLGSTVLLTPEMAFPVTLTATGAMGLAFGVGGAPLNGLPPIFFPARRDTAIVALHTALGAGLAIGPVIASALVMAKTWVAFPLSLASLCGALGALATFARFPRSNAVTVDAGEDALASKRHPARTASFWLFTAIAVLYAFAEGTFSNWAVLYLQDVKHLPVAVAAAALSVFWAAMVAGRLLASMLVLRIAPTSIWVALPVVMMATFLMLPYATTPTLGIGLFALAGFSCSAFFPLSIGIASSRFEPYGAWVSSMLIAALMVGVGLGSYLIGLLREMLALERLYQLSAFYPALVLVLVLGVIGIRRRTPMHRQTA